MLSFLMIFVLLVVLAFAVLQKFVKEISFWLGKKVYSVSDEELDLRAQVRDLKEQQLGISMMDEFARYMKIQRQVDKLMTQIKGSGKSRQQKMAMLDMGVRIALYVLHILVMIALVLIYRNEPLLMLPSGWFFPFQKLVALPTGVPGGVGIGCWILVCNSVVFRAKRVLDL